ncbi:MAG: glycosyltransferase family 4 protein [Pseudomonadota bacterium]|nr:glycosyltransferase family 4 protein [Pseudomonadota bacterium]
MPNVYVIGATIGRGGAYMAYHVGRIAARQFGFSLVNVDTGWKGKSLFTYDDAMETVSLPEMEAAIMDDDLLICNPSFSRYMFGLRLKGRKLMYAQGFTFNLDCRFDSYVAVSQVVARHLSAVYGIEAPVIPAFVDLDACQEARNPAAKGPLFAVHVKEQAAEHGIISGHLRRKIRERCKNAEFFRLPADLPHKEFLKRMAGSRFLLNVCAAEGFGLVPLEAMAMGLVVVGLDGLGGQDFLRYGENSLAVPLSDIDRLPEAIEDVLSDDDYAASLSAQAIKDAEAYSLAAFENAWAEQLRRFLG